MTQNERLLAGVYENFRHNPQAQFDVDELERNLSRDQRFEFSELVKALTFLEHEKKIITDGKGKYQLNQENIVVEGVFKANDKGFGFVKLDDEQAEDVFIDKHNTQFAIDGDRVQVKIVAGANPWNGKGPEGKVEKIVERGVETLVGEFHPYSDETAQKSGFIGYVTSENRKLKKYKINIADTGVKPQMGDMIQISIKKYPDEDNPEEMQAVALQTIGNKNDPGVDIMSIVVDNDIRTEWPKEAMDQANSIPDHVTPEDKKGRVDITDQPAVTIDGDDSKDFDDAVVVEKLPNGNYKLGVHIADVSHYVKEGTPLDKEAFARGNSTYLVDRVIPMLPFRLSNGICSLNEGVERLVLSCDMEITPEGKRVGYKIYPSVMKSHGRLTYNKVNQTLDPNRDDPEEEKYHKLKPMLEDMAELHNILYKNRHKRGAIDFEEPEAKIIVDDKGKPTDIVLHERGTAEKMIESFMLMANETVAEDYYKKNLPFLYRVHETPDQEKMQSFFEFVSAFGLNVKADPSDVKPKDLQKIVSKTEGTPEEAVVQMMMLRSLKQAHYSPDPLGHFGLAAEYYTHFTSPIRRYSDLMVHRMIHQYADQGHGKEVQAHFKSKLPEVAEQTSTQERRSIDTERSVNDLKMTEFMADKVGQTFDAIVSSVISFGMFIQLPNTVEGLIHISNLNDDYYNFDEKSLTLTGRNSHKQFKIGMPIKVKLIRADVEQHQIDFEIYDPDAPKKAQSRGNRGKRSFNKKRRSNNRFSNNRNNGFTIRKRTNAAARAKRK
ncbi:ribonuclease R [Lactobacillus hominis]|uniref:Ribonuclease R n=1 Tax=Lactobacillus hominis DSM 23910 = CRBIP 24.179 TaxID=1423758 RepID=I7JVF3_9LACO|nr:ribonuclease R [Lactobacillus hominis]KRM86235.1 ribonuclease R [Lactobacillus hominis DSM 23910 = CRBIP 24.179]MCT3348542.1 ribonuclease R [Lactobacillus hominis]CCI82736.1 Ribonuclease R [Lactobacillus hominis DSM 23910 = CRBIP 24.179]